MHRSDFNRIILKKNPNIYLDGWKQWTPIRHLTAFALRSEIPNLSLFGAVSVIFVEELTTARRLTRRRFLLRHFVLLCRTIQVCQVVVKHAHWSLLVEWIVDISYLSLTKKIRWRTRSAEPGVAITVAHVRNVLEHHNHEIVFQELGFKCKLFVFKKACSKSIDWRMDTFTSQVWKYISLYSLPRKQTSKVTVCCLR